LPDELTQQWSCSHALRRQLLVYDAIVLQPTRDMRAIRVVVCPVDDTALRIRFILAIELNSLANPLASFHCVSRPCCSIGFLFA
jgi:hypothetical protein